MQVVIRECSTDLDSARVRQFKLYRDDHPLNWAEVIDGWQNDRSLRNEFINVLTDAQYPAYFWETPPLIRASLGSEFEFVLVNSHQLANVSPDVHSFSDRFQAAGENEPVIEFSNLGGDAGLVVPCPVEVPTAYSHLAVFSREAPEFQQHRLWSMVGAALERRVSDVPVWTSTSGLGVYWLHVRLDSYPKYYTFAPYRDSRAS